MGIVCIGMYVCTSNAAIKDVGIFFVDKRAWNSLKYATLFMFPQSRGNGTLKLRLFLLPPTNRSFRNVREAVMWGLFPEAGTRLMSNHDPRRRETPLTYAPMAQF